MRPGSKEEFLAEKRNFPKRSISDRRVKNIPVENDRRKNNERRNHWTMDKTSGISTFTG